MRELTLLETGYLCGGLLLALVLPLLLGFCGPQVGKRSCLKIVWTGQAFLAFAGLAVLGSAALAAYAAAFGLLGWVGCAFRLRRQFRAARMA